MALLLKKSMMLRVKKYYVFKSPHSLKSEVIFFTNYIRYSYYIF